MACSIDALRLSQLDLERLIILSPRHRTTIPNFQPIFTNSTRLPFLARQP